MNEGAGIRTLDLRIKSPLLYQLSYALICSYCIGYGWILKRWNSLAVLDRPFVD